MSRRRGFLYHRNLGTNAAPELGAPKWIEAGSDAVEIDLERPNLGDFVDRDGDGDVDLLTGMGHGGSGLRFFERDDLEDLRRGTAPLVRIDRRPDPVAPPRP